jgi:SM-20-related protein
MSSGAFPVCSPPGQSVEPFASVTADLADKGWCVVDDFVSAEWAAELLEEQRQQSRHGDFRGAGIGRDPAFLLDTQTRGDQILWLDRGNALPAQQRYLTLLEELRQAVNRELFLGLYRLDMHAATYPPGGFYRRHLDAFRHDNLRVLSVVMYLNRCWQSGDGGALRLYLDAHPDGPFVDVLPESGRLVTFLSDRFQHEVRETHRLRSSITGWFSRRPRQ